MDLNSVLATIQWSAPEVVKLRAGGQKMVQTAAIPEGFSDAWRANKDAIKAQGIGMYKDDATGEWSLKAWTDVGQSAKPHNGAPAAPAPSAPQPHAGFEAAAAAVPNWPGHTYNQPAPAPLSPHAQSVADELNDDLPDFVKGEVPQRAPAPQPPVSSGVPLDAVVGSICAVYAQAMPRREIMVALAKVAANYKGD